MKVIKDIVYVIKDELKDAEHCAKLAMEYKGIDDRTAEVFAGLAKNKLENASGALHSRAASIIKEYQMAGNVAPAGMQAVWDWEHSELTDKVAGIGMLLKTYREV